MTRSTDLNHTRTGDTTNDGRCERLQEFYRNGCDFQLSYFNSDRQLRLSLRLLRDEGNDRVHHFGYSFNPLYCVKPRKTSKLKPSSEVIEEPPLLKQSLAGEQAYQQSFESSKGVVGGK